MYIHTFEVSSILNNAKYYSLQDTFKKDKTKWTYDNKCFTYFGLSHSGIIIRMFKIEKRDFYSYSLTYRISARRVIENDNYVGLFDTNDYSKLEKKVNKLLESKSELLPKLNACRLRRLDFCINAELENQKQVKAYIHIAKRAAVPKTLEVYTQYDKVSKRHKSTKDDMTVWNDEYVAISIYNKYRQMKKEKKNIYSQKDWEQAENIVRIEIRCMSCKIAALENKFNVHTVKQFMSNADKIGDYLYQYYLPKMFNNGYICTLKNAVERIKSGGLRREIEELLTEFVRASSSLRSAAKAMEEYRKLYGKKTVKRILRALDVIETSCVVATNDDAKCFRGQYIPTPLELYMDFYNLNE